MTGTAITAANLPLDNSFATLPPEFYTRLRPTPLPAPYLVGVSPQAAALLGLDAARLGDDDFLAILAGNAVPDRADPLAAVYSGHQFGVWAGQLGDGRAILLGDMAGADGPMELQLKGAGLTPYSRMGDGRAVLRSSIREFLCSEAMNALGIPTSRALSVVGSDKYIMRETPETSAVVLRMAPTFVRFGSFEHWYHKDQPAQLKILADYVIARFHPQLSETANPYQGLLEEVTRRTAHMIAHWQAVGFMHGVMNTDNMSILGLTLDYGPFGFMEAFDSQHICNHTDQQGRYSYAMQPQIGHWNCYALGLARQPSADRQEADRQLFDAMFTLMHDNHADFTQFFRRLGGLRLDDPAHDGPLRDLFIDRPAFDAWATQYRARLRDEPRGDAERKLAMDAVSPKYVLRNYLAQVAIEKAQNKDYSELTRLLTVLQRHYDEQPEHEHYAELPPDWASHLEVSYSS